MGRIRTIKPEFWGNEALSTLPEATHMLAAALLNYCDDEGYFNANQGLIKAACFPLREPSVSIHGSLTELSNIDYLELGIGDDGRIYGHILKFSEHQRVNRPTASKIATLSITWGHSLSAHGGLSEASLPEGKGREGKGTGNGEQGNLSSHSRFEEFWNAYPHRGGAKKGRKIAEQKFALAVRKGADQETIIQAAIRYHDDAQVIRGFSQDPATWLNQAGWENDVETESPRRGAQNDRRQQNIAFDSAIRETASGIAEGSVRFDYSDRDPFAIRG